MKNLSLLYVLMLWLTFGCVKKNKENHAKVVSEKDKTIIVKGSTTVNPLMEKLVENFVVNNKNLKVMVTSSGSMEGFRSLLHDSADIAMSSNKISPEMRADFRTRNKEFVEYLLAGDALIFIVNVNNAVKKLTHNELVGIFTGKIVNWKQLGGEDLPIKLFSRDSKSGTYSFFKEMILNQVELSKSAIILKSNEEVLLKVGEEKGAIAYTNFSTLDYSVDPINLCFDDLKTNYIAPRVETVNNMTYKYNRGLYLYYQPEKYQKIKPLMDMIHADSTQKLIGKFGFIPVNTKLMMK
jgi:phosphate transport system substrate-binding protein